MSASDGFVIAPKPAVHFGVGAIEKLPADPRRHYFYPPLACGPPLRHHRPSPLVRRIPPRRRRRPFDSRKASLVLWQTRAAR